MHGIKTGGNKMKTELENKILEVVFIKTGGRIENPIIAKICYELASDFAMQEAEKVVFDFHEWKYTNGWEQTSDGFYRNIQRGLLFFTINEVYDLFKQRNIG